MIEYEAYVPLVQQTDASDRHESAYIRWSFPEYQ